MVLRLSISQSLDGLEQLKDLHTRATHFISFGMKNLQALWAIACCQSCMLSDLHAVNPACSQSRLTLSRTFELEVARFWESSATMKQSNRSACCSIVTNHGGENVLKKPILLSIYNIHQAFNSSQIGQTASSATSLPPPSSTRTLLPPTFTNRPFALTKARDAFSDPCLSAPVCQLHCCPRHRHNHYHRRSEQLWCLRWHNCHLYRQHRCCGLRRCCTGHCNHWLSTRCRYLPRLRRSRGCQMRGRRRNCL